MLCQRDLRLAQFSISQKICQCAERSDIRLLPPVRMDMVFAIVIIPVTVIRLFFCDLCLAKLCYVAISGVSQQHGVPEDIDAL